MVYAVASFLVYAVVVAFGFGSVAGFAVSAAEQQKSCHRQVCVQAIWLREIALRP